MSIAIGQAKKSNEDTSSLLSDMGKISKELDEHERFQKTVESDYKNLAFSIPNMIHESVPIGIDESANVELRRWGDIPQFNFKVNDHIDLGQKSKHYRSGKSCKNCRCQILLPKRWISKT